MASLFYSSSCTGKDSLLDDMVAQLKGSVPVIKDLVRQHFVLFVIRINDPVSCM